MKRGSHRRALRTAALALGMAMPSVSFTGRARGEVLLQTGFEAPRFQAGRTVDGQGGFAVTAGSPGAITVADSNPYDGSQGLLFTGGKLSDQGGGFFVGTAGVAMSYDAAAGDSPTLVLESHALLDGPSTNMGANAGTAGDLVSINMEAVLSDGSYFSTYLSSDGHAYGFTTGYDDATPVALGVYHDLKLEIDFADRETTFYVDGRAFGTEAFDPSVSSTVLSSAQFTMYDIDPPADRSSYLARADDFTVSAVPEPSCPSLVVAGLLAAAGVGRLRRRPRDRRGGRPGTRGGRDAGPGSPGGHTLACGRWATRRR